MSNEVIQSVSRQFFPSVKKTDHEFFKHWSRVTELDQLREFLAQYNQATPTNSMQNQSLS